jgi:hypothetical protein
MPERRAYKLFSAVVDTINETIDDIGERLIGSIQWGNANEIQLQAELRWPDGYSTSDPGFWLHLYHYDGTNVDAQSLVSVFCPAIDNATGDPLPAFYTIMVPGWWEGVRIYGQWAGAATSMQVFVEARRMETRIQDVA